jgi:hypothetical protein
LKRTLDNLHDPLQHWLLPWHELAVGRQVLVPALALLVSPKQASAIPAIPTPNFFSAWRRVADWANPLVSSSNLLFMVSFLFGWCLGYGNEAAPPKTVVLETVSLEATRWIT